jgi:glycosyltransferase
MGSIQIAMKFLFTAGGSQATVFSVAPLATAARNAGHEILLAADEPLVEAAEVIAVPAVSIPGVGGMARARVDALLNLAEDWPPDLVVGGLTYLPGLIAASLKVPYVRQVWDIGPSKRAEQGLQPELERLGLAGFPDPDLLIDTCPPSLQPSPNPTAQPMRCIPRNPQRRLEPWMYTRPKGRPRVLITSGTHFRMLSGSSLRHLTDYLTLLGAEVLIAAPEKTAEELGAELGDVRIGWIPLDVVASTCDLAVHHGGAATALTFMTAGVPQLIIPPNSHTRAIAQALSGFGAALALDPQRQEPDQDPAEAIAAGCREILATPRYTQQAQALAKEIATLPPPSEMVHTIEALTPAS